MPRPLAKPTQRIHFSERTISARYDSAQTTDSNKRHWAQADALSADAANCLAVRKALRERARYEWSNNSYLKGITDTIAIATVGVGPTLNMLTGDDELDSFIEGEFAAWAREIDLAGKMRTMRAARCISGEVFTLFTTNPALSGPVKLDIDPREADQVTDPTWTSAADPSWEDGIHYDGYGNPVSYRVLDQHPGASNWAVNPLAYQDVWADQVFHYYKVDRPGQRRGIPDITPALSIFPELRRFCMATIAAAETAANFAAVLYTDTAPVDGEQTSTIAEMDTVELTKGMGTTLPKGYKLGQVQAEHPSTTYNGFVDKKLGEAARCLNLPFTVAALDSSNANLSARYLDTQLWAQSIVIDRMDLERFLRRVLDLWLTEAVRIKGYLPRVPDAFPSTWAWPSIGEHADPDKVASASLARMKGGLSTLGDEWAMRGQDWENKQAEAARQLGVDVNEYRAMLRYSIFGVEMPAKTGAVAEEPVPAQTLNGAQVESVLSLMTRLREQAITPEAAAEILTQMGIDPAKAQRMATSAPALDSKAGDVAWFREVIKELLKVPQAREAVYNKVGVDALVEKSGLPTEPGYKAPWVAIVTQNGQVATGDPLKDTEGDTVGSEIEEAGGESDGATKQRSDEGEEDAKPAAEAPDPD
jgi:capsid protein